MRPHMKIKFRPMTKSELLLVSDIFQALAEHCDNHNVGGVDASSLHKMSRQFIKEAYSSEVNK